MSVDSVPVMDVLVVEVVDVGKAVVALSVSDAGRHRLLGPVDFEMTGRGLVRPRPGQKQAGRHR
jgi:transposase